jgi:ABC-2 type transport system permease protein
LGYQLIYLVILTLIAGAGSIASDNRNNALLIYLSKPITKNDYLLGKWMGLFLTLFMVAFGPALLLYLYCLTSYLGDGFLRDEPRLFVHILESTALASAVFTSVMIGLSAWSKSPRITGAVLAGIYFSTQIVAFAIWALLSGGKPNREVIVLHSSIGGILSGLTQGIYNVTIHSIRISRRTHSIVQTNIAPPAAVIMWSVAIGLIVAGVIAARAKIRAVEVIA